MGEQSSLNQIVGDSSTSTRERYLTEQPFDSYLAFFSFGKGLMTGRGLATQLMVELAKAHPQCTWVGYTSFSNVITVETDEGDTTGKLNAKMVKDFRVAKHLPFLSKMPSIAKVHRLCQQVYMVATHLNDSNRAEWSSFLLDTFKEPLNSFPSGGVEKFLKLLVRESWTCPSTLNLLAYCIYWEYFTLKDFWPLVFGEGVIYDEALNDHERFIQHVSKLKIPAESFQLSIE